MFWRTMLASALLAGSIAVSVSAHAEEAYVIVIKEHRMNPAELQVPAGQKIKLLVDNQDATPEEFESHTLNREKIIPGNAKATVYIGPLKPGSYEIFGDFHQETAQGRIIAK
jgi:cytochrome b involved in lipid metabolism